MYDYSKLEGRIVEKYGSKANFANATKASKQMIYRKMAGDCNILPSEVTEWCELLGISTDEIGTYFFTKKV